MNLSILKLNLLNFKGTSSLEINFDLKETNIKGDNGTGKTTIVDAFMWLLFGKDSLNRTDFNIKTLDKNNNPIPRLSHEVEGLLLVDGREVKLKRTFNEKWTKKRGSATEEFTGHETGYFVDDVPCSMSEYNSKVGDLCSEQLFKLITNPSYFPSQKKDVQRLILIQMAGEISDSEIAASNKDFQELLKDITGKSLEDYRKMIGSKKKMIKDQLEGIPARIDEVKRNKPEQQEWDVISGMISKNEDEIRSIDEQLLDISKQFSSQSESRGNLVKDLNEIKTKRSNRIYEIVNQMSAGRNNAVSDLNKLRNDFSQTENELKRKQNNLNTLLEEKLRLESEINTLRSNWQTEFDKQLVYEAGEFHCPTCKREFEASDVESKKQILSKNFQDNKERKLTDITHKGGEMKEKLNSLSQSITRDQTDIDSLKTTLNEISIKIDAAEHNLPKEQDFNSEAEKLPEILGYDAQINELQEKISAPMQAISDDSLKSSKDLLVSQNKELNAKLALQEIINNSDNRISELELTQQTLSQELADYEKKEFTIAAFSKAKMNEVEKRTNSLFSIVKFKLFETQINGGESDTCEATVNGVPYSDLNTALKINAGLDIINALCNFHQVNAPIFIDQRESVSKLIPCQSQLINLIVVEGSKLTF